MASIDDVTSARLREVIQGWDVVRVHDVIRTEVVLIGGGHLTVETVIVTLAGRSARLALQVIGDDPEVDFGRWDESGMMIHGDDYSFDLMGRTIETAVS